MRPGSSPDGAPAPETLHPLNRMQLMPRPLSWFRAVVITLFVGAGVGCKEGTGPSRPASLNVVEASATTSTAGLVVATPPGFVVKDAGGNILGGVQVTVTVTSGGGTLTGAPTQTIAGAPTPIGTWTLGRVSGPNAITVEVAGLAPTVIAVVGTAGPPASITVIAGDNQTALAGTAVITPVRVQVRDQLGNGVPNTTVVFSIGEGGGSVSSAPVTTDASGNATTPAWVLGGSAVPQVLRVVAGPLSTAVTAAIQSNFTAEVRFFGPTPPTAALAAFTNAAARIRASIVGDIVDYPNFAATPFDAEKNCGVTGVVALSEIIDDVIIYATVTPIDGPGRVLASAGACLLRNTSQLGFALVGVMRFDADDISGLATSGRLDDTVLHEMLHVVGINAFTWERKGLILGRATQETRFTGVLGVAACVQLGGAAVCPASVPLENTGGPGTADSHWNEAIFDSELMTGFIEGVVNGFRVPNQYSLITIQSLSDIGYVINPAAADPYVVPLPTITSSRQSRMSTSDAQTWELLIPPRLEVSTVGGLRQLRVQ